MKKKLIAILMISVMALCACGGPDNKPPGTDQTQKPEDKSTETDAEKQESGIENTGSSEKLTMTDPSGAQITLPEQIDSIVTLSPSLSQLVTAFGLGDKVVAYDVYRYLLKVHMADHDGVMLYRDYWKLLGQTGHDSADAYWKYPKSLQAAHDKVLEEIRESNDSIQIKRLESKQENYSRAVKKLLKYNSEIDGYSVFVPDTVGQIVAQAKALHQCLVHCDYVSQVIDKKCVLVFIQKDGVPVATCQLLEGDKIGQFYADELDRDDCLPSEDVRAVMNKWIERKRRAA